ncbi:MAG: hypothetical protein ABI811_15535 [Acidobacteriota bacterium]
MQFRKAFYIKLGKGGEWEKDSLEHDLMRIGWAPNSLEDINSGNWTTIETQLRSAQKHRGTATRDCNALRQIVESSPEDVWITFSSSRLYWCRLARGPVQEDGLSKFRRVQGNWDDHDERGGLLTVTEIPGTLSSLQGFRGTVCRVLDTNRLRRLLGGEPSPVHGRVTVARQALAFEVEGALKELHWKDFETVVDLLFRQAGWRRLSVLGETMKFADLELQEPINKEKYQVQVKSKATIQDFEKYRGDFSNKGFRKLFFVVHTPEGGLDRLTSTPEAELVLPHRLADMVVDAGLVDWLLAKIR